MDEKENKKGQSFGIAVHILRMRWREIKKQGKECKIKSQYKKRNKKKQSQYKKKIKVQKNRYDYKTEEKQSQIKEIS